MHCWYVFDRSENMVLFAEVQNAETCNILKYTILKMWLAKVILSKDQSKFWSMLGKMREVRIIFVLLCLHKNFQ